MMKLIPLSLSLVLGLNLLACKSKNLSTTTNSALTPSANKGALSTGKSEGGLDLTGDYGYLQDTLQEYKASMAYKKPANDQEKTLRYLTDVVSTLDQNTIQTQVIDKRVCERLNRNIAMFFPPIPEKNALNLTDSSADQEGIPPYIKDPRLNSSGIALITLAGVTAIAGGYGVYSRQVPHRAAAGHALAPALGFSAMALLYGLLLLQDEPSEQTIKMAQGIGYTAGSVATLTGALVLYKNKLNINGETLAIPDETINLYKKQAADVQEGAEKPADLADTAETTRATSDGNPTAPNTATAPKTQAEKIDAARNSLKGNQIADFDTSIDSHKNSRTKAIGWGLLLGGAGMILATAIPKMGSWDPGTGSGGKPLGQQLAETTNDPLPSDPKARLIVRMEIFLQDVCTLPASH